MLLGQREHAEDASDAGGALVVVDIPAHRVEMRAGVLRAREQRERGPWGPARSVRIRDAMPAARRADVLTKQPARLRIKQPDMEVGPLHGDALPDPAGRRGVVRGVDLDTAFEMDAADAEAVVAKRLDRQRLQGWALLGKHRGDLAFRRAVDARIGPLRVPAIQIGLGLVQGFEALAVQRCLLRMPDA